jgi:hypothetical protein
MPNVRPINFGNQLFQPITQQQTPKSILAQLLLQRGSRQDNTRGAGIRSAGESILGALLQKQAFAENQDRLADRKAGINDFIESAFKNTTKEEPVGTDIQSIVRATGGVTPFDEQGNFTNIATSPEQLNLTRKPSDIVEGDVGPTLPQTPFSQVQIGSRPHDVAGPNLADAVRAFGAEGGVIDPNRIPPDIPPPLPPITPENVDSFDFQNPSAPEFQGTGEGFTRATEQVTVPNENRELLLALNKASGPGGLDLSVPLQFLQQQQQFKREDTIAAREAKAKLTAADVKNKNAVKAAKVLNSNRVSAADALTASKILLKEMDIANDSNNIINTRFKAMMFDAGATNEQGKIIDKTKIKGVLEACEKKLKVDDTLLTLTNGKKIRRSDLRAEYMLENDIKTPLQLIILEALDKKAWAAAKKKADSAIPFSQWAKRKRGVDITGGTKIEPEEGVSEEVTGIPLITTQEEFDELPKGAHFTDEDGIEKIK